MSCCRGLFCRSIQKSAAASVPFTPIYAAMAAIVNTKLPQVGELLVQRLVVQFKKAYKRNDKAVCMSSVIFLSHLTNQQVVSETLVAQILLLLLHKPTDDSVELSVGALKECGQFLEEFSPAILMAVFDQLRSILHDSEVEKRTQYQIEVLFQIRKDKWRDHPSIQPELDLVEEEDQITHRIGLDDEINVNDSLNVFKFDPDYEENEAKYQALKAEILGEAEGSDEEYESGSESEGEEAKEQTALEIKDATNTDLVNLRRTIYLTIMSSSQAEEATHKLMKLQLPTGQETELVSMIVECCSQERTYNKASDFWTHLQVKCLHFVQFYGIIASTFAQINRLWRQLYEESFATAYDTCHRRETNQLRNVAKLYGHLLSTDSIDWVVLSVIHLNEEETTSSSRIFLKILVQDLAEALGMKTLQERLRDPILRSHFEGLFPMDNPRNTRFSINYFTSIGMGGLTEEMREHLKNAPKPAAVMPPPEPASDSESVSSYSSYSSYSGSSRSYSRSRSPSRSRAAPRRQFSPSRSRTPPRRNGARDRSRTPVRRNGGRDRSVTPPRRVAVRNRDRGAPRRHGDGRARTLTPSRSPSRRRRRRSPSYSSRSRTPPRSDRRKRSYS